MEKTCPICGKTLKDDATVCLKCGTVIPSEPAEPTPVVEIPVADTPAEETPVVEAAGPKFCIKCGNPLEAGVAFCCKCGAPVAAVPGSDTPAPAPKKPMSKKTKIIIGIAAGAVALILILVALFGGFSSPESAMNNYVSIMNGDMSKIEKMAPAAYWEYLADDEGVSKSELIAELKEEHQEEVSEMREYYGLYKVSSKVLNEEDLDDATLAQIAEALTEYGIKKSDVKAGKTLTVSLSIQGLTESDTDSGSFTAIKIGTSWYLIWYYTWSGEVVVSFFV